MEIWNRSMFRSEICISLPPPSFSFLFVIRLAYFQVLYHLHADYKLTAHVTPLAFSYYSHLDLRLVSYLKIVHYFLDELHVLFKFYCLFIFIIGSCSLCSVSYCVRRDININMCNKTDGIQLQYTRTGQMKDVL
jgi:hypothetical protein